MRIVAAIPARRRVGASITAVCRYQFSEVLRSQAQVVIYRTYRMIQAPDTIRYVEKAPQGKVAITV